MTAAPTIVIGFSRAATIREADDIVQRLKEALAASNRIEVDCGGVVELDVTFIQSLLAARKSAVAAGKTLTLSGPADGALLQALSLCGALTGAHAAFWIEGRAVQ